MLTFKGVHEAHEEWHEQAQCVIEQIPTEVYYPKQYGSLTATKLAVKACVERCSVREQCLDYGLRNRERHGYFGGVSERSRRDIRTLGLTATEWLEGIKDGSITEPKTGRPKNT